MVAEAFEDLNPTGLSRVGAAGCDKRPGCSIDYGFGVVQGADRRELAGHLDELHTASTLGPIDPVGKRRLRSSAGVARTIGFARVCRKSASTTDTSVAETLPPGEPRASGPNTRYPKTTTERFVLTHTINHDAVAYDARMDGIFPLITNDKTMNPTEVLAAYKYQPNLERRHGQLKGH
jgi:hypothetical protein